MSRGRYYSTVMPIWAILYVIGIFVFDSSTFTVLGALVFALLAVVGIAVVRPEAGGRQRVRKRNAR